MLAARAPAGCSILFAAALSFPSLLTGNKPALIGCLSRECNLAKVEQHLIAIRTLLLSSIGRKNLNAWQTKLGFFLLWKFIHWHNRCPHNYPGNIDSLFIAEQGHRASANAAEGLDCLGQIVACCLSPALLFLRTLKCWPCQEVKDRISVLKKFLIFLSSAL